VKDQTLKATVEGDELVIRIGIGTLAFAAEHCCLCEDDVVDPAQLARDVCRELNRAEEDGSSPITALFDDAISAAFEDGSNAFEDDEDDESEGGAV
jgi:hypothetical protein